MMKDYQIRRMFDQIAFSYDFQNSFLSLRQDVRWRRRLAERIPRGTSPLVLDVATGTAEIAMEICRRRPGARLLGIDYTPGMLAVGRAKVRDRGLGARIALALGDGRCLPLRDAAIDVVTIAFGIRNIEPRPQALCEFRRVLKPGGRLLIMEFDLPEWPLLKNLYRFYFNRILPPVGNFLSQTDYAYSYLAESVYEFPREKEFIGEITAQGFRQNAVIPLTFGIAKIYDFT